MKLDFSRPLLMGIVNITPDSFSDGGQFDSPELALRQIEKLINDGADIIDIGAESTFGPYAQVSAEEEIKRLRPVLESLPKSSGVTFSIDTYKSQVAEFALSQGVHMINDVTAMRGDPAMVETVVGSGLRSGTFPYVCLIHSSHETPYAQKIEVNFERDVITTIKEFLKNQTDKLVSAGFPKENIIIDPGMGMFLSSDPQVSHEVIDRLSELSTLGCPILVGHSMKSFLGGEVHKRKLRSLVAGKRAVQNGASILRIHDVKAQEETLSR